MSSSETPVIVFSPTGRQRGILGSAREVWEYRGFIEYLTKRELKTMYNRSYLGWLWSLINPIIVLAIYWFVFGQILSIDRGAPSPTGLDSFAHFLMSGLILWNLFSQVSNGYLQAFQQSVALRKKLYFPPSAHGVARTIVKVIESSLELLVLVIFYVAFDNFGVTFILVPVMMLLAAVYGMGVGMLLAVPNVRYRDVGYLYSLALRLFFYLTPIIWPYELIQSRIDVPLIRFIAEWNPLAKLIEANRDITYRLQWPDPGDMIYLVVSSTLLFLLGWRSFHKRSIKATEGL
ncbi:MAG: ABC transporter permease [Acidimicrobiales bacterium]